MERSESKQSRWNEKNSRRFLSRSLVEDNEQIFIRSIVSIFIITLSEKVEQEYYLQFCQGFIFSMSKNEICFDDKYLQIESRIRALKPVFECLSETAGDCNHVSKLQ